VDLGAQVYSLCLWKDSTILVGLAGGVIKKIDTVTGAISNVVTIAGGGNVTSLASDGRWFTALAGTKAFLTNDSLSSPRTETIVGAVAVTISGQRMWVAQSFAGFYGINIYELSAGFLRSITFASTSSTPTPLAITSDGQFVVVTHDLDDNSNNISVFPSGLEDNIELYEAIWQKDSLYAELCAIDDSYVYVASGGYVLALDRLTGTRIWVTRNVTSLVGSLVGLSVTCDALYGAGMNGSNARAMTFNLGHASREYQVVDAYRQFIIPQALHAIPVR
jgi:outer membrane protein assembly factor BamB